MTKNKTENERILLLENNHQNLMEKIDDLIERFNNFDKKLDRALEEKANVWVEKAFTWLLYFVGSILITALMYLIIKK